MSTKNTKINKLCICSQIQIWINGDEGEDCRGLLKKKKMTFPIELQETNSIEKMQKETRQNLKSIKRQSSKIQRLLFNNYSDDLQIKKIKQIINDPDLTRNRICEAISVLFTQKNEVIKNKNLQKQQKSLDVEQKQALIKKLRQQIQKLQSNQNLLKKENKILENKLRELETTYGLKRISETPPRQKLKKQQSQLSEFYKRKNKIDHSRSQSRDERKKENEFN